VGKAAKRFAFSIVAAVSIGLPPFTPSSAEPAAFLPTDFAQEPKSRIATIVKTIYIYAMSGRLFNVRLDKQRIQKARKLRASGVPLSDLVRDAIDRQYEQLVKSSRPRDVAAIIERIYEQYPDPPGLPPRDYDVRDRVEARNAILRKLRNRR
jgi:hypothetical protein